MSFKKTITAVVAFAVTAAIFCVIASCGTKGKLTVYNSETGKIYATFPVTEGSEFAVEFIHSVNKSPIKDVFVVRDEKIYLDRSIYTAFGAGVQTEVEAGQTLKYDEDGNMVISGYNMHFPVLKYIVGTVYDHILYIEGESISLTELCGRNSHIAFELK